MLEVSRKRRMVSHRFLGAENDTVLKICPARHIYKKNGIETFKGALLTIFQRS